MGFIHAAAGYQSSLTLPVLQASFVGAMAIADLVKTTLGPKGMVKFLPIAATENRGCCRLQLDKHPSMHAG